MAQRYGFFNSVNNDRVYDASDVARFLKKFFTNGVFNNTLQVRSNDNMTVTVSSGNANIEGYSYENDDNLILDVADADSTLSRIDSVILRLDLSNRQITAMILQGSYASEPSQPSIVRTGGIYDLRLANISVPAETTRITSDLITDTRFTSDCGNVVGTVQQLDTNDVFQQYEAMFNNWFGELQAELDGNVAANLENQIIGLENKTEQTNNALNELYNSFNVNTEYSIKGDSTYDWNTIFDLLDNTTTGTLAVAVYGHEVGGVTSLDRDGAPPATAGWGVLYCIQGNARNKYNKAQIYVPDMNNPPIYVRTMNGKAWSTLSPGIDSSHLGTNGYIRLQNGLQIAWVEKQVSVTFQAWGNIYFADVSNMPNWEVPFTSVYQQHVTCNNKQFWFGGDDATTTSPGSIRVLRATSGNHNIYIKAIAIGSWK